MSVAPTQCNGALCPAHRLCFAAPGLPPTGLLQTRERSWWTSLRCSLKAARSLWATQPVTDSRPTTSCKCAHYGGQRQISRNAPIPRVRPMPHRADMKMCGVRLQGTSHAARNKANPARTWLSSLALLCCTPT